MMLLLLLLMMNGWIIARVPVGALARLRTDVRRRERPVLSQARLKVGL